MAKFPARRVFLTRRRIVSIAAAALVAGAAAAMAAAAASGSHGSPAPSSDGSPAATMPVVRTNLTTTVQEGGSIGYDGSYTVAAPSGASASQVSQQEQLVAQDQQQLSADEQAASDAAATGDQTMTADAANVSTDRSTLTADQATEKQDCAATGGSASACSQDEQKVSQDRTELTLGEQQLAAAQTAAKTADDQARGKVGADEVKLQGDQAALTLDQSTAVSPGTTYTWLPAVGQTIKQDQPAYAVSGVPVPLLYGAVPAYRAFYSGMSDGADVGELTDDLIALGYGDGLTQSNHYSPATAAAVERWQQALGLPETGEILLGDVVFEPGPIRVTSLTASVGGSVGGGGSGGGGSGTVLTATSTTAVVTVDLDVTQEYLVKKGDAVSVVLPDGSSTVGGHVESVGTVATCPGGSSTGTASSGSSGGSGSAGGSPCSSAGSSGSGGSNSSPTVTVTINLDSTPPGATFDQAPVNVNITSQTADNVLAVPVNALLALADGGYAVQVVTGSTSHLVRVTTGVYSDTLVQVSGPGITAGLQVEVPSS